MQAPPDQAVSAAPAPQRHSAKVKLTYEDVVKTARLSVLDDFRRQQEYRHLRKELKRTGGYMDVVSTEGMEDPTKHTRQSSTRLLKEHNSSAWSLWFFQWSLFGGFAVTSVAAVMSAYLGFCHNRMFLTFSPFSATLAYKTWGMLENTWEQQRYAENAAQIRNKRLGNPLASIVNPPKDDMSTDADMDKGRTLGVD
mmetsp:Transcript_9982/g.11350  ORF Transcript_9982/g.11350 Transcript_9982/m.11350 type:complete len:196 (-) Transcript_9982:3-590(-)